MAPRTRKATASIPPVPAQSPLYVPLHQKYRPQTFADLVGQAAVAQTLIQAIEQGRIVPAYLFIGIRGTGKTSSARILAKSLNCLSADQPTVKPCGTCEVCRAIAAGSDLDVIEIDAASNTGVDNIRRLIEESHLAPMRSRYRVWIIDEVHKLSNAAMNALLKSLEEPPAGVVFVLATTEPEQVLATIRSRAQQYPFLPIEQEVMSDHLSWMAQEEGIEIEPSAIARIAQASGGGMRDATSLLDQVSLLPAPVTVEAIDQLTGAVPEQALLEMMASIIAPELTLDPALTVGLVDQAQTLAARGKSPIAILEGLTRMMQLTMQAKYTDSPPRLTPVRPQTWETLQNLATLAELSLLRQVNALLRAAEPQIRQSMSPQLWLESVLLEVMALVERA